MIFPSLFTGVETGMLSQFSILTVIAFSFFINHFKKIFLSLCLIIGIGFFAKSAIAAGAFPSACGTGCMANMRYYGSPGYVNRAVYPYPRLPFHTMYGPTNYYFRPYPPSPYMPADCIDCMMRYRQYTQPYTGMGNMGITYVKVPYRND